MPNIFFILDKGYFFWTKGVKFVMNDSRITQTNILKNQLQEDIIFTTFTQS